MVLAEVVEHCRHGYGLHYHENECPKDRQKGENIQVGVLIEEPESEDPQDGDTCLEE